MESQKDKVNEPHDIAQQAKKHTFIAPFMVGIFVGILVTIITVWSLMPGMMIVIHQSRYDSVEETCQKLKESIIANGWQCPAIRNMNKAMQKHGVSMEAQVRIVELCHAKYAKEVLQTNPEVSTLMPCALGVYKGKDGKVYISGMNMGLMGKMFGGNIANIMGNIVSKDEKKILHSVVVESK